MKINTEYFETLGLLLDGLHMAGLASAVIGGGAIRDALAGKPIADIDVFYDSSETLDTSSIYFKSRFEEDDLGVFSAKYDNSEFTVTHHLFSKIKAITNPIQLIATKSMPMKWVSKFPHSISRCVLTTAGLIIPVECLADFHKKSMFLYDHPNTNEHYLAKIKAKYHDWEIIL
jgi:hypothetical protein